VAADRARGRIYVADTGNDRVMVATRYGTYFFLSPLSSPRGHLPLTDLSHINPCPITSVAGDGVVRDGVVLGELRLDFSTAITQA